MSTRIAEIAKALGLPPATVRSVVEGRAEECQIAPEVKANVLRELERQGGRAGEQGRARLTRVLGMVITDLSNAFFANVAASAERTVRQAGFTLLILASEDDGGWECDLIGKLRGLGCDGLIVAAAGPDFDHLVTLQEEGFPFVLVDRVVQGLDCDAVLVENQSASRELCETLLHNGARRMGFIGGPVETSTGRERLEGYRAALRGWHLRFDNSLVYRGEFNEECGRAGAEALMALQPPPDALFCANNKIFAGAVRRLAEGTKVPWAHIPIACFDELPFMDQFGRPLVLAAQPEAELGKRAAELLIARVLSGPPNTPRMGKPYTCEQLKVSIKTYGF